MAKIRVAVVMGGTSSEHDISMKTGEMIAGNLNRERYDVVPVTIHRDGQWKWPDQAAQAIGEALGGFQDLAIDCAFLALHGPFGEDGRIQGLLDWLGVPYTGSGCAASAIAMDKVRAKAVAQQAGLRVADHLVVEQAAWEGDAADVPSK